MTHIKSEKAKEKTKLILYLTLELSEKAQRSINKAQKVMTIHIINEDVALNPNLGSNASPIHVDVRNTYSY